MGKALRCTDLWRVLHRRWLYLRDGGRSLRSIERDLSMNKPTNEMALETCDCSSNCLCTRSHEQFCDGHNCNCWCHRPAPYWGQGVDESIKQALKKVKEGNEEEMKE